MKVYAFVYGSLLKDLHNHHHLNGASQVTTGSIRAKLFTHNWSYPFIRFSNSNKDRVVGEVYEVEKKVVNRNLNYLEGYHSKNNPGNLFERRYIIVQTPIGKIKAYAYRSGMRLESYMTPDMIATLSSGDWKKEYLAKNSAQTKL